MLKKCTKIGLCFRYRFTLYIDECRTTNDLSTRDLLDIGRLCIGTNHFRRDADDVQLPFVKRPLL